MMSAGRGKADIAAVSGGKQFGEISLAIANRDAALERAKTLAPIFDELDGKSAREIARILNDRKIATATGAPWSPVTVARVRR
jgi:Recombinase